MTEDIQSKGGRRAMAAISVLFGLFVVGPAPILVQRMLDEVLLFITSHQAEEPGFAMAATLIPIFMFAFRALSVVAGVALIVLAYPLWKGEAWAWPAALACISVPTMSGVLFVLPYVAELGKPPRTMLILFLGLAAYWALLLIRSGSPMEKLSRFLGLTLLGMLGGHGTILVIHSLKSLLTRPDKPLFTDPKITIFGFEGPINAIVVILCALAIPLVAARRKPGWYLAVIAGLSALVADYPTHFIRLETSDFFVGGTLGLLLAIVMLVPVFKRHIVPAAAA